MEKKREMPVLLLTGYLGSGKTTLVNRILSNRRGIRFAVIVNDIGEVNIDADLIARDGIVGGDDDSLVALQNGCICCTLKMDLVQQLTDLMEGDRFDYIVIEASGICEPEPIAQTICSMPSMGPQVNRFGTPRLDCIVTVADALRLKSEFNSGQALTAGNIGEEDLENLIIQQIEFCNIVVLNKISEVSAEEANQIRSTIRAIQPKAEILEADYADVPLDKILNTGMFNFEQVATSATWIKEIEKPLHEIEQDEHEHHHEHDHEHDEHHGHDGHEHHHHHHHHHSEEGEAEEYGISTFVYYRRRPFSINKFDYFVDRDWPEGVIRTKGVCYFSDEPEMSYLFEQAGVQKKLTAVGQWYATAPEEDLKQLMEHEPGLMRDWDPEYGDRMQKLVFIGRNMDRAAITDALDFCLD
ncbi:MAG: GTP-binding protein [Firmicutes bacterium]|nr:GTP-binding protein [Bacillota bacterium]MCM1401437.1 GTP-binding protein [Bacteroides sp.]